MPRDAIAVIRRESERLSEVLADTPPTAPVPTCPEWTADDLLWHLTEVHEFWSTILAEGILHGEQAEQLEDRAAPRPAVREELLARREAATAALLAQLHRRTDEESAWFWYSARQDVGVIRRMQTHEATIHRVDAELTAGTPLSPIAEDLARDGLDHVLEVMWPSGFEWIPEWARTAPVADVEIRPDGAGQDEGREPARRLRVSRWSGTRPRDGADFDVSVARLLESAESTGDLPQATVTGAPATLDLWAWGRSAAIAHLPAEQQDLRTSGDPVALTALGALIDEGHD
jgi:uncharacterized protein (TIGR03083 family)